MGRVGSGNRSNCVADHVREDNTIRSHWQTAASSRRVHAAEIVLKPKYSLANNIIKGTVRLKEH